MAQGRDQGRDPTAVLGETDKLSMVVCIVSYNYIPLPISLLFKNMLEGEMKCFTLPHHHTGNKAPQSPSGILSESGMQS